MRKKAEIKGKRFGKLVAIEEDGRIGTNVAWICKCDCGNVIRVRASSLLSGNTTSCGCKRIESITKHNMTNSPLFNVWRNMKERCENKSYKSYENYGGRGVKVCNEWKEFSVFYEWAMDNGYERGLSIDRIDNDGGYNPANCRWVKMRTQSRNRRTNVVLEYDGEKHCLADWAKILGINRNTIGWRYRNGWTVKEILYGRP